MVPVITWFNEMYVDKLNSLKNCNLASIESKFNVIKGMLQTAFDIEVIDSEQFDYLLSELNHVKAERLCFLYKQEKKDAIEKYGNDKELVEIYCRSYFKDLGFESIYNEMIAVEKAEAEFERVKKNDAKLFENEDENLTFYYGYFAALSDALFNIDVGNAPAEQELHK